MKFSGFHQLSFLSVIIASACSSGLDNADPVIPSDIERPAPAEDIIPPAPPPPFEVEGALTFEVSEADSFNEFREFLEERAELQDIDRDPFILELSADIDFGGAALKPLPPVNRMLFRGNGYTLKDFRLESGDTGANVGLFDSIVDSQIYDLRIQDASAIGNDYVGIFAGELERSYISNLEIEDIAISCERHCGSMIGEATQSRMDSLRAHGDIRVQTLAGSSARQIRIGGLFGRLIRGSFVNGIDVEGVEVLANDAEFVGGVAGEMSHGADMRKLVFRDGLVQGKNFTGGVTGYMHRSYLIGNEMTNIRVFAKEEGKGALDYIDDEQVNFGGLVGSMSTGSLAQYNLLRSIEVEGAIRVGAVTGRLEYGALIRETAVESATVRGDNTVGGLAGNVRYGSKI